MTTQTGYSVESVALLKAISTVDLPYGFQLSVAARRRTYQYEPASTATANDQDVISPDSGVGRWHSLTATSSGGGGGGGGGGDLTAIQSQVDGHTVEIQNLGYEISVTNSAVSLLQTADTDIYSAISNVQLDLTTQIEARPSEYRFERTLSRLIQNSRFAIVVNGFSYDSNLNLTTFYIPGLPPESGGSLTPEPNFWISALIKRPPNFTSLPHTFIPVPAYEYVAEADLPSGVFGLGWHAKIELPGAFPSFSLKVVRDIFFEDGSSIDNFVSNLYDASQGGG